MKAVYPGSFDPFTMGHYDILKRAVKTYDEVIVLFAINPAKAPRLPFHRRLATVERLTLDLQEATGKSVQTGFTEGLVSDFVNQNGIDVIVRGLRDYTDLKYELNIERFNQVNCDAETVYFTTKRDYMDTSSSFVWEFVKWGKLDAIKDLVPPETFTLIQRYLEEK